MLATIKILIAQGLSAYHIAQVLKANGKRVYCFGSYYTVGKNAANRVCFYETDNGVKTQYVNAAQASLDALIERIGSDKFNTTLAAAAAKEA